MVVLLDEGRDEFGLEGSLGSRSGRRGGSDDPIDLGGEEVEGVHRPPGQSIRRGDRLRRRLMAGGSFL